MNEEYDLPVIGLKPEIKGAELHRFICDFLRTPQLVSNNELIVQRRLIEFTYISSELTHGIVRIKLDEDSSKWSLDKKYAPYTLTVKADDAFEVVIVVECITSKTLREIDKSGFKQHQLAEPENVHLLTPPSLSVTVERTALSLDAGAAAVMPESLALLSANVERPIDFSLPASNAVVRLSFSNDTNADETTYLLSSARHSGSAPPLLLPLPSPQGWLTRRIISDPLATDRWCCVPPDSLQARFIKGAGATTNVIWPLTFYGLLFHDFILYLSQPENRYGNNPWKILGGVSPNQITLTTMLGSDLPTEWQFWLWFSLLVAAPFITGALRLLSRSPAGLVFGKYPNEKLADLRANAPLYRLMSNDYLQWSRGYKTSISNNKAQVITHAVFWGFNALIYFADLRILEILLRKFIGAIKYRVEKEECQKDKMIYQFMEEFGNYVCGVCPDWPFVYVGDVFTSQGCINGLLAQSRSPEFIVASLQQLQSRAKPYFQDVDLTQQNWTNWLPSQWQLLLNQLSETTDNLRTFNLSSSVPNIDYFDDGKINDLADFTQAVQIAKLDLSNQGIGPTLASNLTSSFNFQGMTYLSLSGTMLDSFSFLNLTSQLPSSLKTLIVSNNMIDDFGLLESTSHITNSSIMSFDISYNDLTGNSVPALAAFASSGQMSELNAAGNDFSNADFTELWTATTNNNRLKTLSLADCNLVDGQLVIAAPYLINTSIKNWVLQNNQLTDFGISAFFSGLVNSTITGVIVGGNFITDNGLTSIAEVLPQTELDELGLADCSFTNTGLLSLAQSLVNSTVDTIVLAGNFLDDDSCAILATVLSHRNNLITYLDLSRNQISDTGGKKIAFTIKTSDIETLILDNNALTCVTAIAISEQMPGSALRALSLNQNQINSTCLAAISNKIAGSVLSEFNIENNPVGDDVATFAESLITSIPNEGQLSDSEISLDQARWLHNNARTNTSLKFFNVANTGMTTSSARVLCRVLPTANISLSNTAMLPNNGVDPNKVNLLNCRLNQNTNSFFSLPRNTEQAFQTRSAYAYEPNANSNLIFAMLAGIMVSSLVMSAVAMIYLFYSKKWRNAPVENSDDLRRTDDARNSI